MTTEFGAHPTLRSYFIVLRRRKWWISCTSLIGLALSAGFSLSQVDQYSATAQILVRPSGASLALGGSSVQVTPTDVQTDLQLVTSAPVERIVNRRLGSTPSVSASQVMQTNVIAITAVSTVPARAAVIANTYARAFVRYQQTVAFDALAAAESQAMAQVRALGKQIARLRGRARNASQIAALLNEQGVQKEQLAQMQVAGAVTTGGVAFVTPAQPPVAPSSPKPAQDALLGLAAGLVLGLAIAFVRDNLDDVLTSKENAEQLSGAPVLAMIPMVPSWKKQEECLVVAMSRPLSPAAEAYRSLRTSLQFIRQDRQLKTLLVTSPAAAEGKTSTIANLGAVFANAGERVLLISCDLRRPRLGKYLCLSEHAGFTSILQGADSLVAIQPVAGHESLWMLGSGPIPSNPAELLTQENARELFESLRASFDLILIDSPPVLPVTDAAVLSKYADGVLVVIAAGQTKCTELQRAAERLSQVNAAVIGAVLNEVTSQNGYGYGYGYGQEEKKLAMYSSQLVTGSVNGSQPSAASAGTRHRRLKPELGNYDEP